MQYTLPAVRGLVIHMEGKRVTVLLPRNRYDQVIIIRVNNFFKECLFWVASKGSWTKTYSG